MPFNRIAGFYVGHFSTLDDAMTLDEQNAELNATIDGRLTQLNAVLDKYEAYLRTLKLVESVWHEYDMSEAHGQGLNIGMYKYDGSWRLCHSIFCYGANDYEDIKPLVDSSLVHRMLGIKHLRKLKEAIVCAKKKFVPRIEKLIEEAVVSLENEMKPKKDK